MKTMPGKITPAINAAVFRALPLFLPLAAALFFASCSQDDIFYQVEYETKLRDPLIEGGPGQLVKFNDALYVASGSVWTYPESGGGWRRMSPQPPGIKILDIAATTEYLYAVTNNGVSLGDSGYWRLKRGESEWKSVQRPSHPYPNAIYGTDDTLFVAAASGSYYAVYALNDNPQGSQFSLIRDSGSQGKGMLMGAVKWGGKYFISLDGMGVFRLDNLNTPLGQSAPPIPGSTGKGNFTGFEDLGSSLLMVSASGSICELSSADDNITDANSHSLGFTFTGALAVWNDPKASHGDETNRLLLLGRKGSNSNYSGYGYYECPIPSVFSIKGLSIREPTLTVSNNATYKNSLGKRAINSIIQAEDGVIFASTQSYNLWACRDGVWNYE